MGRDVGVGPGGLHGTGFIGAAIQGQSSPELSVDLHHDGDLILDQKFRFDLRRFTKWEVSIPGEWGFKFRIKNLTDSRRQVIYDRALTNTTAKERRFDVGRDFKFSLSYKLTF